MYRCSYYYPWLKHLLIFWPEVLFCRIFPVILRKLFFHFRLAVSSTFVISCFFRLPHRHRPLLRPWLCFISLPGGIWELPLLQKCKEDKLLLPFKTTYRSKLDIEHELRSKICSAKQCNHEYGSHISALILLSQIAYYCCLEKVCSVKLFNDKYFNFHKLHLLL